MASIVANLPPPAFLVHNKNTLFTTLQKVSVSPTKERTNRPVIAVKAVRETSGSSSSLGIVRSVQSVWDDPEDRWALAGLGFAAVVAVWASANLVSAVDRLPLIPSVLELVGILYSSWFIYRYLLFKPDREELFQIINKSVSQILNQ